MTRSHRPVAVLLATVAAGLAALAGCGVPIDGSPRPITQTTVSTVEAVPTTIAPNGAPGVSVYFLNGEQLEAEEFAVEGEVTLGKALNRVLDPPTEGTDLDTAVPPNTRVRGVQVTDGEATIDLTGEINDISGPAQKQAFAQIVFTALGFDEVQRVRFLVDGRPIDAPTDEGNIPVVEADDYQPPLNPR